MLLQRSAESAAALLSAVLLSAFMSRGTLRMPGIIGMRHDWPVLAFPGEWWHWTVGEFTGFSQIGLGNPGIYPGDWIVLIPYGVLSFWLSPAVLSRVTIVSVPAVASLAMYVFLRRSLTLSPLAAAAGGAFFALSPVLFNKMVAGQLGFLWSYALLPLWLMAYRGIRGRWSAPPALFCCVLAGILSNEIQFVVFMAVLALFDVVTWKNRAIRVSLTAAAATLAGVLLTQAATVVSLVVASLQGLTSSVAAGSPLDWIAANSARLEEALELRGYVTHYFEHVYSGSDTLDQTGIILSRLFLGGLILAAATVIRQPVGRFAASVWIFAAVMASGINGPLGHVFSLLYRNVQMSQAFRELYHWSALSSLAAAMLIALLIAQAKHMNHVFRTGVALILLAILAYCHPSYDGVWGYQIQAVQPSTELTSVYNYIARTTPDGRILWLPLDQPVSLKGAWYPGIDPMAYSSPPSLWEYTLRPPISTIDISLRAARANGLNALLQYCGVAAIIDRHELVSQFPAFLYRRYASFKHTFASGANVRGVGALHWPLQRNDSDVTIWRAPVPPDMVTAPAGIALTSPTRDALAFVPPTLTPAFNLPQDLSPSALVYDPEDRASLIAALSHRKRDLVNLVSFENGDAEKDWTKADAWWEYDEAFTRAFDFSILSLRAGSTLTFGPLTQGQRIIISFIASPKGGSFLIRIGNQMYHVHTNAMSPSRLRSISFPVTEAGVLSVTSTGGVVALRKVESIPSAEWLRSQLELKDLERTLPVTLLVSGTSRAFVPRDAFWLTNRIRRIDGGAAKRRVFLRRGIHSIVAANSGATLSTLYETTPSQPHVAYTILPSEFEVTGHVPSGVQFLALKYAYATGWTLRIDGTVVPTHFSADGFMNGWHFKPSANPRTFVMVYSPSFIVTLLHAAGGLVLICIFISAVYVSGLSLRKIAIEDLQSSGHSRTPLEA